MPDGVVMEATATDHQHQVKSIGKLTVYLNKSLGEGSYGKVFRGMFENKVEVAVKRIDKSKVQFNEQDILIKVDTHENIVRYYCTEIAFYDEIEYAYVAIQLCAGSLYDFVFGKCEGPEVSEDGEILYQIVSGLEYLHEKGVAHRDLNPRNILISFQDGTVPRKIKIADFGFSRRKGAEQSQFYRTVFYHGYSTVLGPFGTHGWIGPEGYKSKKEYDSSVDLFPLGCIFFFVLSKGKHPFSDKLVSEWDEEELENIISRITLSTPVLKADEYGTNFQTLIEKMLHSDPVQRPKAPQVKNDSYFKEMSFVKAHNAVVSVASPPSYQFEPELLDLCNKVQLDETELTRFEDLIRQVSNINYSDLEGRSALLLLSLKNRKENQLLHCLKTLFELRRKDVNATVKDVNGDNALILISRDYRNGDLDKVIQLLLSEKVDIDARDKNGDNILFILCRNDVGVNLKSVVQVLIDNRINLSLNDVRGDNILFILISQCYEREDLIDIFHLLIATKDCYQDKNKRINMELRNSAKGFNAVQLLRDSSCHIPPDRKSILIQLLIANGVKDGW